MKANYRGERAASTVFHAITHVWGREYLDTFLDTSLPSQLASGNVPALPAGSRYRILTRSIHREELNTHPMVRALRKVIPVDIVVIDALDRQKGVARQHDLMKACHQRAVADVLEANAAIIFLSADFIFSADALAAVVQRHRQGYRAVVNTGLRLNKESFLRHLDQSRAPLAALSSRELMRMALPHLHPHTTSKFADARSSSLFPTAVYWRVGSDGLLARCLHLHPLMVDPMRHVFVKGTIDGRYVFSACPDFSRVHVVTDSDELQMFELTTAARSVAPSRGVGVSAWRAAAVAAVCDDHQVGYWRQHPVRLHTGDFDERWSAVAATADAFAERALRLRRYGRLARRGFRLIELARQRRERYQRAWRRRLPRVTFKLILRPVRLAVHRSAETLRKTLLRATRRLFGQARAR